MNDFFKLGIFGLTLGLVSCGGSNKDDNVHRDFINNNGLQTTADLRGLSQDPVMGNYTIKPTMPEGGVCGHWLSKYNEEGDFRIAKDMILTNDGLKAKFDLEKFPQARFGLSAESGSPLSPPSLEEFNVMVQAKWKVNPPSSVEKFVYNRKLKGAREEQKKINRGEKTTTKDLEWMHGIRNEAVVSSVEEKLPGVFGGDSKLIKNTSFGPELFAALGIEEVNSREDFYQLQDVLSNQVNLFDSNDWYQRKKDLAIDLFVLSELSEESSYAELSLQDKACHYALSQRVTAQILTIKGIAGAPEIDPNTGNLYALPNDPDERTEIYPNIDELGSFDDVVGAQWITDNMSLEKTNARVLGAHESPKTFFSSMSYFAELATTRNTTIWADATAPIVVEGVRPTKISNNLLALAVGLWGVTAKTFSDQGDVLVGQGNNVLSINKENDSLTLAYLHMAVLDTEEMLAGLEQPSTFELNLLGAETLSSLASKQGSFEQLEDFVMIEEMDRIDANKANIETKRALRLAAYLDGNTELLRRVRLD